MIELPADDARVGHRISITWSQQDSLVPGSAVFACDTKSHKFKDSRFYIAGSSEALGQWDPERAIPLQQAKFIDGIWLAMVSGLPAGDTVEWKCLKKSGNGQTQRVEWQPGYNHELPVHPERGYSGMAQARWSAH